MNELGKFCPPPGLTATPRQVERVTQLFWESGNAASPDLFQQVTSRLLAFFRAQGCALPVAANPEYIVSESSIGDRFRNPASVARRLV